MIHDERFDAAIIRFDAVHREGPHTEILDGQEISTELLYAQRMTQWLERLEPNAPEEVQLAARSQHIRRWTLPRSEYPMDRRGYLRWRTQLKKYHAEVAGEILREVGYEEAVVQRVGALLRKEGLTEDPEMQLLEDVICLVFLENYFSAFAQRQDEQKMIGIIQKTWTKMTSRGHEAALNLLEQLSPEDQVLLQKALAPAE